MHRDFDFKNTLILCQTPHLWPFLELPMPHAGKLDCLIIGQGLAGSALAMRMLARGWKILVINRADSTSPSQIAAGLFNPVTGKMFAKTWMADELFPFLHHYYRHVEEITGVHFFYSLPIYGPFANAGEQNEWMARSADGPIRPYVKKIFTTSQYPGVLNDPLGGYLLDQCGYVDTKRYTTAVRKWLEERACYVEGSVGPGDLRVGRSGVRFGRYEADAVVFCEGVGVFANPWFDWVPIKPLKGEMLSVRGKFLRDVIVNKGVYMVPGSSDTWHVGATYEREFESPAPTVEGKNALEERLRALSPAPYEVVDHRAGVRPSTPDRRPLIGTHPEHSNLVIFNGMGTKGISLAPYFSAEIVAWFEKEKQLPEAVDISRYKSLYWNSR